MTTSEQISDLIGKDCVLRLDENLIPCRIKKVFVERELKWPYESDILLKVEPLHQMELTEIEVDEIARGVQIQDLLSIEWE
jgi:hypothetical protein